MISISHNNTNIDYNILIKELKNRKLIDVPEVSISLGFSGGLEEIGTHVDFSFNINLFDTFDNNSKVLTQLIRTMTQPIQKNIWLVDSQYLVSDNPYQNQIRNYMLNTIINTSLLYKNINLYILLNTAENIILEKLKYLQYYVNLSNKRMYLDNDNIFWIRNIVTGTIDMIENFIDYDNIKKYYKEVL